MRNKILLCSLLITIILSGSAQVRSIENIGFDDVSIIELAGNGDVWAGSSSQGVAFYQASSQTWSYFDSLNSPLKSNTITSIAISPVAGIQHSFIGTINGGVITQSGPWDTITQVSGQAIRGITYRPDSLWVVTASNFMRYDSSLSHVQDYPNTHPGITCLESATQCAGFWIGTANAGCYYTSNGATLFDSINTSLAGGQLPNNHVNAIAIDQNCDRLFIGTLGGFSSCPTNGPPCLNYTTANGLPQNDVTAVVLGCNGNVWLGTRDSGVVVFSTQNTQFTRVTTTSSQITALACAQNCVTYVGAKDGTITLVDSLKNVVGELSGIKPTPRDLFSVRVFPQPAGNQVNFVFEKEVTNCELLITDISGRTLQSLYLQNSNNAMVDVSRLQSGIYFYQLYGNRQLLKTGKVEVVK